VPAGCLVPRPQELEMATGAAVVRRDGGSQHRCHVLVDVTCRHDIDVASRINTSDDLLPCAAGFAMRVDCQSLHHERGCLRSRLLVPLLNVCWPWQSRND